MCFLYINIYMVVNCGEKNDKSGHVFNKIHWTVKKQTNNNKDKIHLMQEIKIGK